MRRTATPPPTALTAAPLAVIGMAVATHSVVRYRLWIVVAYTLLALGLAAWQLRRAASSGPGSSTTVSTAAAGLTAALALAVPLHLKVTAYSYTTPTQREQMRWLFALITVAVVALLVVALLRLHGGRDVRRLPDAALAVAAIGYLVAAALLITWSPHPKIDVWVTLQQAADAIGRPQNFYALNWHDSPGVQDAFTYLPFTALLLAPGRWLAGDVRWALVVVTLLGVLAVRLLAGRSEPGRREPALVGAAGAALLLLLPGTMTQVEQAWTEPLLFACVAGWALGVQRLDSSEGGRAWSALAVVCLALGLASKQHLVLLLPLLAVWPRFGWRRTLASAVLGGAFVLPWFLASPADMWHDTVTMLIDFQPLVFADTLFIAAVNDLDWTPPFWLTGFLVLGTWVGAVLLIRRRQPDLAGVLRWAALVLFVANLVNKQAFYNQYWLVAALVVVSLAVPTTSVVDSSVADEWPAEVDRAA